MIRKKIWITAMIAAAIVCAAAVIFIVAMNATLHESTGYHTAVSSDGETISYHLAGHGNVTLLFIHGWSCDSRYWKQQIPYFAQNYQVAAIDLAGHSRSSQNRDVYSMESFGLDVKAVAEDLDAQKVILIGHSMGGAVMAEAAKLMPDRVIGLVGVDTLHNVEEAISPHVVAHIISGFRRDFENQVEAFVEPMLPFNINSELKEWIISNLSAASPDVAISAFEEYTAKLQNMGLANIFKDIKIPVHCINGDLVPTNIEANRQYMVSFDATIMNNVGHFPMLEKPEEFSPNFSLGGQNH